MPNILAFSYKGDLYEKKVYLSGKITYLKNGNTVITEAWFNEMREKRHLEFVNLTKSLST